ncbi:MAG: monofunctional biosynthetic peptidoglycan transglycosylase [Pseudomonadota bacterium]|nr:monofunctional biosynthetic peptidoglycan transglycosylase [Pseudomonadota bacterium]
MSRRSVVRRLLRLALWSVAGAVLLSVLMVATLRFVDPWTSGFMVQARIHSWFDDDPRPFTLRQQWRDYPQVSPQLALAVVASEDQRFPVHWGFDFRQIRAALDEAEKGRRMRGASTISQQVARNVFLWNGRSWIRKGAETWFTVLIEALWSKQRILEVYLNVAEFGPGIYGAEAAAQAFFGKPAARLSRPEAARLAAVLPNPKRMSAARPGAYMVRRQGEIERQMAALGGTAWLRAQLQR